MRLVVDASVAVKWFAREEDSDRARRFLEQDHELHVPRLLASEVSNALWSKVRTGKLERSRAREQASEISRVPIQWADDEDICADAVRLSTALDRPVYDCVYLALAHRLGATLVTADLRFANALAGTEHEGAVVTLDTLATNGRDARTPV